MRITLNIDDATLSRASELSGVRKKTSLVKMGLEALIERESSSRLAALGGTQKTIKPNNRRRSRLTKQTAAKKPKSALDAVVGMWKDRTDLPDFAALRREWDRK
jgi:hypothetical protein